MADTNINDNGGGSAVTVLVTVIIVALIGAAFYFGYFRHRGAPTQNGLNIDVTVPTGTEGGSATQ